MNPPSIRLALASVAILLSTAPLHAQSIWGVAGPTRTVSNTAGPPGCGACTIAGPLLSEGDYGLPSGGSCAVPGAFPGPTFFPTTGQNWGDVTVNRVADTGWVTDGLIVTEYNRAGATISDFLNPLPLPLTGLGYQAPNTLWLTDGYHYAAVTPPTGCGGTSTAITPWFPVNGPSIGFSTDIDYDPCSGAIYLCFSDGMISRMTTAGALSGIFAPGLTLCPLMPFLTGLAVDTATPGTLFVTDGVTVARVQEDPMGTAKYVEADTTIYAPCCSWPWAGTGGPTSGLAFDATPIETCPGCNPTGGPVPVLKATHQAISPNMNFGLQVTGAPVLPAVMVIGPPLCPGVALPCGCTLCVTPQIVLPFQTGAPGVPMTIPLPAGWACLGIDIWVQILYFDPITGCVITSNALNISIAAP